MNCADSDPDTVVSLWKCLEFEFSASLLEVFDTLRRKVFLINGDMAVMWRNKAALRQKNGVVQSIADVEDLTHSESHVRVAISRWEPVLFKLTSNGPAGETVATFNIIPIRMRSSHGQGGRQMSACLVFVDGDEPVKAQPEVDLSTPSILDRGLTPVERVLVRHIVAGRTLRDAAAAMGISYNTARKYMQTIFSKTGVRRQVELVARARGGAGIADTHGKQH